MLENMKRVCLGKRKQIIHMWKTTYLKEIGEYPLNIPRMLNILHVKNKWNIVTYKLNLYKTSTK